MHWCVRLYAAIFGSDTRFVLPAIISLHLFCFIKKYRFWRNGRYPFGSGRFLFV
jgi:hypothetical protein